MFRLTEVMDSDHGPFHSNEMNWINLNGWSFVDTSLHVFQYLDSIYNMTSMYIKGTIIGLCISSKIKQTFLYYLQRDE